MDLELEGRLGGASFGSCVGQRFGDFCCVTPNFIIHFSFWKKIHIAYD
jgi:hypothetical protein